VSATRCDNGGFPGSLIHGSCHTLTPPLLRPELMPVYLSGSHTYPVCQQMPLWLFAFAFIVAADIVAIERASLYTVASVLLLAAVAHCFYVRCVCNYRQLLVPSMALCRNIFRRPYHRASSFVVDV
jgi:hypothetical protein